MANALAQLITRYRPFRFTIQKNSKGVSGLPGEFKGPFVLDITYNESVQLEADITQFPVEDGPDVSDHIRIKPVVVTIDGFVSEAPLNLEASIQGAIGAAGGLAGNLAGGFGQTIGNVAGGFIGGQLFGGSQDPAQMARDALEDLFNKRVPVTLVTKRKVYTDMVMSSLSFPRDQESGTGLKVQMRFQKIVIVKAQTVTLNNLSKKVSASAAPKAKLGNQTPNPPSAEQSSKGSSLLLKLKTAAGL
jgi:hypothetical protein